MVSSDSARNRPLSAVLAARERHDIQFLIQALSDPNKEVRHLAVHSLKLIGVPQAVGPLLRMAQEPGDRAQRVIALQAIGTANGREVASDLVEIGSEGTPLYVRVTAISVLVDFGDERAVPLLIALVGSPKLPRELANDRFFGRDSLRGALKLLVEAKAVEAIPTLEQTLPGLRFRYRLLVRRALKQLKRIDSERPGTREA